MSTIERVEILGQLIGIVSHFIDLSGLSGIAYGIGEIAQMF